MAPPSMLKRMQTATVLTAGVKVPFRKRLRVFTEDRRVEGIIIVIVLLYFLVICLDFAVPEVYLGTQGSFTDNYQNFIITWTRTFWVVDLVFLSIFIVEICLRLYAWGLTYLKDILNFVDMLIVGISFVMLFVTMDFTMFTCLDFARPECSGEGTGIESTRGILRVFRIVRIFRIVIILNKIKRSRENAEILRKKAKYRRQGSPVERVVEILQRLRRKAEKASDRDNIAFIVDAIVSDQLYTVNVSAADASEMTTEMNAFLLEGGALQKQKTRTRAIGGIAPKGLGKGIANKSPKGRPRVVINAPDDKPAPASYKDDVQPAGSPASMRSNGKDESPGNARVGMRSGKPERYTEETAWVEKMMKSSEVGKVLQGADSWDFSIFDIERASNQHPILVMVLHFVQHFDLESSLPIPYSNLVRLLLRIEAGYKQVPFHNHVHGADVTQGTAYFLMQEVVSRHVSPLDIYCMILGAALHDFEHPGYNNAFLVASRDEKAILYNDVSVLENFHISSSWRMMLEDSLNPFAGFSDEQYVEARQTMVYAILGTDMKFHFDHLTKFKTRVSSGVYQNDDPDRKDVRLLLAMCMHSADVSNPAKRWELTSEWAARVMEEFFRQGEREEELNLPVSPFMDRQKTDIAQCQAGFISILIKPFFDEWTQFLGESNRHIFVNVESNIKTWTEQGEAALGAARVAALKQGGKAAKAAPAAS